MPHRYPRVSIEHLFDEVSDVDSLVSSFRFPEEMLEQHNVVLAKRVTNGTIDEMVHRHAMFLRPVVVHRLKKDAGLEKRLLDFISRKARKKCLGLYAVGELTRRAYNQDPEVVAPGVTWPLSPCFVHCANNARLNKCLSHLGVKVKILITAYNLAKQWYESNGEMECPWRAL